MDGSKKRLLLIDTLRGVTILSMIVYHAMWDVVFLKGRDITWYRGTPGFIWQQSICCTFIFLSGFCIPLSRRTFRRGMEVFLAGVLVSAVTILFLPENRILFGVLTLIGTAMLLMAGTKTACFDKVPATAGLLISLVFFCLLRGVNEGYWGILFFPLGHFPEGWYRGLLMTFLGFPDPSFFSTDYFSVLPWVLLFLSGYFFHRVLREKGETEKDYWTKEIPFLSALGRHSLPIYLVHQVVLYGIFMAV